jgi:hypothetical protein
MQHRLRLSGKTYNSSLNLDQEPEKPSQKEPIVTVRSVSPQSDLTPTPKHDNGCQKAPIFDFGKFQFNSARDLPVN